MLRRPTCSFNGRVQLFSYNVMSVWRELVYAVRFVYSWLTAYRDKHWTLEHFSRTLLTIRIVGSSARKPLLYVSQFGR